MDGMVSGVMDGRPANGSVFSYGLFSNDRVIGKNHKKFKSKKTLYTTSNIKINSKPQFPVLYRGERLEYEKFICFPRVFLSHG